MLFKVSNMTCDHCKTAIQTAVADAGGRAEVDLVAGTVAVAGLDPTRSAAAIRAAGYDPVDIG